MTDRTSWMSCWWARRTARPTRSATRDFTSSSWFASNRSTTCKVFTVSCRGTSPSPLPCPLAAAWASGAPAAAMGEEDELLAAGWVAEALEDAAAPAERPAAFALGFA